ncbi:MAG: hypothetical protein Q7T96_19925 [Methylobacter sp.]|nr:hypothetical protein [Methylobacter sp.]
MALQSDSQGFLIGNVVGDISRAYDQLKQIKIDVRDIKRSLLGAVANVRDNSHSRSSSGGSNARNRGSSASGQSSAGNSGVATPNRPRSSSTSSSVFPPESPGGTVIPNGRGRDASGRFSGNAESTATINNDDRKSQGIISGFTDRIATAVKASAAGAEDADPTIKAFQEVAEPMRRGYEIFTGGSGGDKKERWYKKIFKELNLFRKDESVFNRAANRSLRNIEDNPGGSSSGGSGGGFLGGTGALMLGAKALLRKVPILGALLGGIDAFGDVSSNEDDNTLTRGEKDKRNGKSIGGAVGTFGGMMAGAKLGVMAGSFGGPIGAAIGGVVGGVAGLFFGDQAGQVIGEKAGEWTTELRDADIPGKIIGAWNTTTDAIKSGWDGALKLMSDTWSKAKDAANAVNDFVKEKTGVDVKAEVKNAHQNLVNFTANEIIPPLADLTNKGVDKLKQGADWVGENTTVGRGMGYIKGLLRTEGKTRVYDKGNGSTEIREGGTVAWRNNNPGNLKFEYAGSADKTVKSKRTKEQALLSAQNAYDGVVDLDQWGNAIFNTEDAGRDAKAKLLTKKHGNKTIEEMLSKYAVSDYSGKADTQAYAAGIHKLAASRGLDLKGKKILDLNPDEFGALMDGMKKVEGFKEGKVSIEKPETAVANAEPEAAPAMPSITDDPTQGGRYNAINANYMPLYHQLAAGPVNTQVQTASTSMPKVPTFAPPPPIAEAPPIIQPLGSDLNRSISVNMPAPDVGQDVRDRGIAHIVTGGMSGRG